MDYLAHPETLLEILEAAPASTRVVLIDEVQKVPALLDAIQVVLDSKPKRFRFLLSGSSARKLKRGQANLLPGRVVVYSMHPLLERELGASFKLERAPRWAPKLTRSASRPSLTGIEGALR